MGTVFCSGSVTGMDLYQHSLFLNYILGYFHLSFNNAEESILRIEKILCL